METLKASRISSETLAEPRLTALFKERTLKRLFDILFSSVVLILLSPLFGLIALAIRLSSQGAVIYAQQRLGKGGKVFRCYKFRSMYTDADLRLKEILQNDPVRAIEWQRSQKLLNDPRIFKIGRFLRQTSLDELPQFFNVLKGDLSVVGPRPYMVSQRKHMGHLFHKILSLSPGITGLWQTSGRSTTTFEERIFLDARYVEIRSFWLDLRLILKTIPQVLFSKNAH